MIDRPSPDLSALTKEQKQAVLERMRETMQR